MPCSWRHGWGHFNCRWRPLEPRMSLYKYPLPKLTILCLLRPIKMAFISILSQLSPLSFSLNSSQANGSNDSCRLTPRWGPPWAAILQLHKSSSRHSIHLTRPCPGLSLTAHEAAQSAVATTWLLRWPRPDTSGLMRAPFGLRPSWASGRRRHESVALFMERNWPVQKILNSSL